MLFSAEVHDMFSEHDSHEILQQNGILKARLFHPEKKGGSRTSWPQKNREIQKNSRKTMY